MINNSKNQYTEVENENAALVSSSGDSGFVFLYKKTEKVAAAIYLVTDLLDHEEPLRWSLRQNITSLLNLLVSLRDVTDARMATKNACRNILIDLVTQLNVASTAGLISQMNGSVLIRELNSLADRIDQLAVDNASEPHFSDEYFKQSPAEQRFLDDRIKERERALKDVDQDKELHSKTSLTGKMPGISASAGGVSEADRSSGNGARTGTKPAVQAKKNKRQRAILHLIKEKGEVGVKDVATVVPDCSEKTLQRELMALVTEGVLEKTGKRRWTRYSFA